MTDTGKIAGKCLQATLTIIQEKEEELYQLDAVAGDGDHGAGMVRGLKAAVKVSDEGNAGQVLTKAGAEFSNAAGGASGALYGMFCMTIGNNLQSDDIHATDVHQALSVALEMVKKLGKSDVGDKTMIDTIEPFVTALGEAAKSGMSIKEAWLTALPTADEGRASTINMIAKRGRSAILKEKSRGSADPGATSIYYIFQAVGTVLSEWC
jgi:dihydroxyacetone kinase phosphoprotein-dependent L subunit